MVSLCNPLPIFYLDCLPTAVWIPCESISLQFYSYKKLQYNKKSSNNVVTIFIQPGSDIDKCILKYLEDNDVDINELEGVGCDGSATNTDGKVMLSAT
ncbi:hypothetical protein AVEN_248443-1 [Araneus ventricosus]|uniref:Uncharacterized protein n=1 Tax=Araneus ventricosus TaxID=182803 RepID=A0A4Y2RIZ4_ARAVE|nr:hypothetical protein AVEN_248443-1 [Araneus ventricosus]